MTQDLPTLVIAIATVVTFYVVNKFGITDPSSAWVVFVWGGLVLAAVWVRRLHDLERRRDNREGDDA